MVDSVYGLVLLKVAWMPKMFFGEGSTPSRSRFFAHPGSCPHATPARTQSPALLACIIFKKLCISLAALFKRRAENGASGPEDSFDTWDTISVEELEHIDTHGPPTPLLDTVNYPMHMKNLSIAQLRQLCKEIRSDLVHTVSQTGGHLGSSLGVVELTVALHHVFECPADKFIFDVGHQAYVHKMLTGRRHRMGTIRQYGGLSGMCPRCVLIQIRFRTEA